MKKKGPASPMLASAGGQIKNQRSNDPKMIDKIAKMNASKLASQKIKKA
jgi:hypothetical protein